MTPEETLEQYLRSQAGVDDLPPKVVDAIRAVLDDYGKQGRDLEDLMEQRDVVMRREAVVKEENERLRASVEGWEEEAKRSHQNVAWRDARIEAALALRLKNLEATCPCIVSEEPDCNHGADVDLIVKALRGEK